jgi:hypothetical protein
LGVWISSRMDCDDVADDILLAELDSETVLWVALYCTGWPLVYWLTADIARINAVSEKTFSFYEQIPAYFRFRKHFRDGTKHTRFWASQSQTLVCHSWLQTFWMTYYIKTSNTYYRHGNCCCYNINKGKAFPNKSWRLKGKMECWVSTLTLTLGTTGKAELSALRAGLL